MPHVYRIANRAAENHIDSAKRLVKKFKNVAEPLKAEPETCVKYRESRGALQLEAAVSLGE